MDPREWLRAARGAVDFDRLRQGLSKIAAPPPARRDRRAAARRDRSLGDSAAIILARGDATGVAFRAAARGHGFPMTSIATDSHSYADALDALEREILARLAEAAASDGPSALHDGITELKNTD
jgi:hypothetical protein